MLGLKLCLVDWRGVHSAWWVAFSLPRHIHLWGILFTRATSHKLPVQVSYGSWKSWKVMNFQYCKIQAWKSWNIRSLQKRNKIIVSIFLKRRYYLSIGTPFWQHFRVFLVMDFVSYGPEKSWKGYEIFGHKKCTNPAVEGPNLKMSFVLLSCIQ